MFERLTVRLPDEPIYIPDENKWSIADEFGAKCLIGEVVDRLAAYEDSGLSPEQLQEIAKVKADGRLKILKAALFQTVWFYDGANRLMQGKVIEYLDCGNGLIYQVQGAKKGLWLHEHEIFLSQEEALLAVVKPQKRHWGWGNEQDKD